MLLMRKHIFAVTVACLFLYPTIYQSIHVFEHTHDAGCCTGCSLPDQDHHDHNETHAGSIPFATYDRAEDKEEDCPVCEFHYAKQQVTAPGDVSPDKQSYFLPLEGSYPEPHVLFDGFYFSLRAPPAFISFC